MFDAIMVNMFGLETKQYKEFYKHYDFAMMFALKKAREIVQKRKMGQLTPAEANCYVNQALARQEKDESVTLAEAESIVGGLFTGGVDTTGGALSWKLMFLAAHPHVQERLYEEILPTTKDGKLTENSVSPTHAPYLHAFLREAHRCGNPVPLGPIKVFPEPVEVHGVKLPANCVVGFDSISQGFDPELVEDPTEFRPERFLPEAVKARQGTPSEVIDHLFFSGPFSQGARRCPGSRVANLEMSVLMSQLVLDWQMKIPSIKHWSEVTYGLDTLTSARLPPVEFTSRK